MFEYKITKLSKTNIDEALNLIWNVFLKFDAPDYSEEGVENFKKVIDKEAVTKKLLNGDIEIFGCWDGNQLIGVLAIKKPCHVWLMFVDEKYHRKSVAKNMFTAAFKEINSDKITVNSSLYAVEVYERLGFEAKSSEQTVDGIRFIPMIKFQ